MQPGPTISIFEVVGSPLCVASSDGQKVYDRIVPALKEDRQITLSFRNITILTSAFLNTAIGQLYGGFRGETLRALLKVEDMESEDYELLRLVVETAKLYFKDPKRYNQAVQEEMGKDSDD